MHPKIKALIDHYHLTPLPIEGTLFVRTYCSTDEYESGKPVGTAMIGLYCDEPLSRSLFHKLKYDEVWHFYGGDPLRLVLLHPDGSSKDVIMGNDPLNGQLVQFTIPAGVWQAGHMIQGGLYSLYGCTVAPGFTDDIFEAVTREHLLPLYPDRVEDINKLCISGETKMPEGFAS
jgi:predicted cupin superfamily sugar epimerase